VPNYSASGIDPLPVDCSDGIAAVADTVSECAAGSDAGSVADIPASGHACTAKMKCLRNGGNYFSQTGVRSSYASGLPSLYSFFQS
jgi:hypothetical protein